MILIKKEKYINIYKIFDFIVRQELSEFTLVESKVTKMMKQEATKSLASQRFTIVHPKYNYCPNCGRKLVKIKKKGKKENGINEREN